MGIEIERKFLVKNTNFKEYAHSKKYYQQGYIHSDADKSIRIRIVGQEAFVTIKGTRNQMSRLEFEYAIPFEEAQILLKELCGELIEKERYLIKSNKHTWEVDVFLGKNKGLIVAEIELETEEDIFDKPEWLGKEVTQDSRYFNSNLSKHPFESWDCK